MAMPLDARTRRLIGMTLLLLVAMVSRTRLLNGMSFDIDETRTAMRAMGTIAETVAWQPLDWPPLYNVLINLWQRAVSPHPVLLRMSSILFFMPGIPLAYHAAHRLLNSERAAWGAAFVYAALGYSVFLSLYLRAYTLALTLFPLLLIFTHDYFERIQQQRWQWLRGIALGVVIALLFYTTYTALLAFAVVGLYTLLRYRLAIWHWWLPVLVSFGLVLPNLLAKADFLQSRVSDAEPTLNFVLPAPEFVSIIFFESLGQGAWFWLVLGVVALGLLLWHHRDALSLWLVLGVLAAPVLLYVMLYLQLYFIVSMRYVWWGLLLLALLLGAGLARLPRIVWGATMALTLVLMFAPTTLDERYPTKTDVIEQNLSWLGDNIRNGDVVTFDPNPAFCWRDCYYYDRWVYYGDVLMDGLLPVVDEPTDEQRVWYIHIDGLETESLQSALWEGRMRSVFYGPPGLLMELYEGPPDPQGILFGETLRFHGLQWLDDNGQPVDGNPALIEQTEERVRLWWSVDEPPSQPLSVSLQLIDSKGLVLQDDQTPVATSLNPAIPLDLPPDMTTWEPGKFYVETRTLPIPSFEDKFMAEVALVVYQWWDNTRLSAPESLDDGRLSLGDILVIGW